MNVSNHGSDAPCILIEQYRYYGWICCRVGKHWKRSRTLTLRDIPSNPLPTFVFDE